MYPKCISRIYKVCDDEIQLVANLFGKFHDQYGISSTTEISYKIIRKIDNKVIGVCLLELYSDKNYYCLGNIGIKISDEFKDNDYIYKIVKLLGQIALNFNVKKLNISTLQNDTPIINVAERLNAKFIGFVKVPRKAKLKLSRETLNCLKKQKEKKLVMYEWKIEGDK